MQIPPEWPCGPVVSLATGGNGGAETLCFPCGQGYRRGGRGRRGSMKGAPGEGNKRTPEALHMLRGALLIPTTEVDSSDAGMQTAVRTVCETDKQLHEGRSSTPTSTADRKLPLHALHAGPNKANMVEEYRRSPAKTLHCACPVVRVPPPQTSCRSSTCRCICSIR